MRPVLSRFSHCSTYVALCLGFLGCVKTESGTTTASSTPASTVASRSNPAFARFVDTYFDSTYSFAPSQGSAAGFHQYDNKVEDLSAANFTRRIATLHWLQQRLDSIRSASLVLDDSIDAAMID
ncbi:MAG: hypothetical protein M3Z54_09300, partial [Gemmatimonadota bacterium]|nr:hypothetical protein [Gemmatimonadota bacterium]